MTQDHRARVLRRADELARTGRTGEARDCLLAFVHSSPADWSIVQAAAELCARTGRTPDAVRLYLGMARHFARQGVAARADQIYEEVLRLAPGDAAATFRRAELAAASGDRARARALLATAVPESGLAGEEGAAPMRVAARPAEIAAGLAAGRFDEARQALIRLTARSRGVEPELTAAWLEAAGRAAERVAPVAEALADVCLVAGEPEAAVRTLREFLSRAPGEPSVLRHLIAVAVEAGSGAVALEAQAALVDALSHRGRWPEAIAVAEDLVARMPDAANRERLASVQAASTRVALPAAVPAAPEASGAPQVPPGPDGDGRLRDLSDALEALGAP